MNNISLNQQTLTKRHSPITTHSSSASDSSYSDKRDSTINRNIVSINQSRQHYITDSSRTSSPPTLVINEGDKLSRSAICELLVSAARHADDSTHVKLITLANRIERSDCSTFISPKEEKLLLNDLYKIRKLIPGSKNNEVGKAIRLLEKLIHSCLLNKTLKNSDSLYQQELKAFSHPRTAQSKNITGGIQISGGCSIADDIMSIKGTGKIAYTQTYTTDIDDEGIVAHVKENKYQATAGIDAKIGCTNEISLQLGGEISAKKTLARGVNYAGGASDYFREKLSHKQFSYKKNTIADTIFTHKHSLLHHQQLAQNSQPLLKETWSTLANKNVESKSPVPFQAEVKNKSIHGMGLTANVKANAQLSSLAKIGGKLQYDFAKNDIKVDIHQNMYAHITSENSSEQHVEYLNAIAKHYSKAFSSVFNESGHVGNKNAGSPLSIEEIKYVLNALDSKVQEYSECVQKYSAGQSAQREKKHAFEEAWGVKQFGRYGFLQCAEVILATLASRLLAGEHHGAEIADIREQMSALNDKIINPEFTHDKRKLLPLVSFRNLLSINNQSHTVTAELNANLGNKTIQGGGKISIAIINKHVENPNRMRAGEQRDIEITLSGNVVLSNVLSKLTHDLSNEIGVKLSDLHSAVTDAFSSTIESSKAKKIIVRYFSPDWSNDEDSHRIYAHQVTYVQLITSANITANITSPSTGVGGGFTVGAGTNRTDVIKQKMGTDTLNYLMLRYNYVRGKPQEQSTWQNFVQENRENILSLMNNIVTKNTNSNRELMLLIKEKLNKTSDLEKTEILNKYTNIRQCLFSVQNDANLFDEAFQGLITLMNWHYETTSSLSSNALKPIDIVKPQKNILQKALSTLS